jgi:hypothetical protein
MSLIAQELNLDVKLWIEFASLIANLVLNCNGDLLQKQLLLISTVPNP